MLDTLQGLGLLTIVEIIGPIVLAAAIVYGIYHLVSREVDLPFGVLDDGQPNLYDPPTDADGFRQLGLKLACCDEITRMLQGQ